MEPPRVLAAAVATFLAAGVVGAAGAACPQPGDLRDARLAAIDRFLNLSVWIGYVRGMPLRRVWLPPTCSPAGTCCHTRACKRVHRQMRVCLPARTQARGRPQPPLPSEWL